MKKLKRVLLRKELLWELTNGPFHATVDRNKRKKLKVLLKCHIVKSLTGGSKKLQQVTNSAGTKEELAVNRCFLAETDGLWPRIRQLHKHKSGSLKAKIYKWPQYQSRYFINNCNSIYFEYIFWSRCSCFYSEYDITGVSAGLN